MDAARGWVQQFHLGVLRGLNTRLGSVLGPDTGFDSMGDTGAGQDLWRDSWTAWIAAGKLAKTILYNLNPSDNDLMAAMIGNFQDGTVRGKMQLGTAWWFNDQIDGMRAQMAALSNSGVISAFVGMVTDSRSFLSYPRHDYFRRLLCGLFGDDIEARGAAGRLPAPRRHRSGHLLRQRGALLRRAGGDRRPARQPATGPDAVHDRLEWYRAVLAGGLVPLFYHGDETVAGGVAAALVEGRSRGGGVHQPGTGCAARVPGARGALPSSTEPPASGWDRSLMRPPPRCSLPPAPGLW